MTAAERVQAIVDYGFTEREARFLILVMRHSGLCVKRQYAHFAGIANGGDRCNALFTKLTQRGFATAVDCIHNRARLFHLHHKLLYHAIGEGLNRYRRTVPARAVAERLMRLDAALVSPGLNWLTTRPEKVAHFASAGSRPPESSPKLASQGGVDVFPGAFPIGVDGTGRAVVVYVATRPWTGDFRTFLAGHVPWLAVTSTWTVRIVFPHALRRAVPDYQRAVHEELESKFDAQTINDLGWYFFHLRRRTDWSQYPPDSDLVKARFVRCAKAFTGPRFTRLYRCWLSAREAALAPIPSAVGEAFAAGCASLECIVLPHDYEAFSPLVRDERTDRRRNMPRAKRGTKRERQPDAASTGPSTGSLTDRTILPEHGPHQPTTYRVPDNAFCLQQFP